MILPKVRGVQPFEEFRFLIGRQPEEHHDAIAKHHGQPVLADAHGKRRARQDLALEAGRIDAVADLQRMADLRGGWPLMRQDVAADATVFR